MTTYCTKLNSILAYYLILLFIPMVALSFEQLSFDKTITENKHHFSYQWLDADNKTLDLSFTLNGKNVNGDFRHFKALKPSLLKMHSLRKLKEAAAQVNPREGFVKILPSYQSIEYQIQGKSKTWITKQSQRLDGIYKQALKDYLYQEYYVEFDGIGASKQKNTTSYKPDHARFAKESGDSLQPIIDAIHKKMPRATARKVAIFLLSWLQNIPYDEIQDRSTSNGSGFLPPIKVIANNKGDCDSKTTLMATILKRMFPKLRIAIIYVPKHALIGLNVSHLSEDYKIDIDGLDYTLAEPVGPALVEFAEVSDRSKQFIESGNYSVEVF